jgi:hypothetical protein
MIYFIQSSAGIKVGRSRDPEVRLKNIQVDTPFRGTLVMAMVTKDDVRIETNLKAALKPYRMNGEWFCCGLEKALRTLLDLKPYSDHQPLLDLPVSVEAMDKLFPEWFIGITRNPLVREEDTIREWDSFSKDFLEMKNKHHGDVGAMVKDYIEIMDNAASEAFATIRKTISRNGLID